MQLPKSNQRCLLLQPIGLDRVAKRVVDRFDLVTVGKGKGCQRRFALLTFAEIGGGAFISKHVHSV